MNGYRTYSQPVRKRRRGGGSGCLPVLLLVVLIAGFAVWSLGYVDRWLYELSLERAGEERVSESAAEGEKALPAEGGYAYSQLNEEDQKKYRIVVEALETREQQPYPSDDMDDLHRIFQCVQADHPEFFFVDGVTMETVTNRASGMVARVSVQGRFAYSKGEEQFIRDQLENTATRCLEELGADAGPYEKSRYFYEWLADRVTYDRAKADANRNGDSGGEHSTAQTLEGALLEGSAVCGGYASAFQYLMQASGEQCTLVTGSGDGGLHAWCLVLLDGDYYYVDPTWADPQSEGGGGELGYVNYDYLNVTTDDLLRTHEFDDTFPLPDCTATADNYYVREDLLFDSPDEVRLGLLASDATLAGVPVQVRFADEDSYIQIRDYFVENGRLGSYMPGGAYRYSCSDENWSMIIMHS